MKAQEIEQLYQEATRGYEEPTVAYLSGRTLKEMSKKLGAPIPRDNDGNPILDGEAYCMIAGEGIFRVE